MKAFIKWVEKCGYEFYVVEDSIGKTFYFGNGIEVIKYENKNGGIVYKNRAMYSAGNNKDLIKLIEQLLKEN